MTYFLSPIVGVADTFPEGESKICLFVFAREAKRRSKLPGGTKKYVILNAVKNPTEELTGIYFSLWSWDISLALNMTTGFLCRPIIQPLVRRLPSFFV